MKLSSPQVTSDRLAIFIEIQHMAAGLAAGSILIWGSPA